MNNDELATMLEHIANELRDDPERSYGLITDCCICQLYAAIMDDDWDDLEAAYPTLTMK